MPVGMLSDILPGLCSLPWLEEAVMIVLIAVVFIYAHRSFVQATESPQPKEKWMQKHSKAEWEETPPVPAGRKEYAHEAWRATAKDGCCNTRSHPKSWVEIAGVTDSRFTGTILSYREDAGYGFVKCPELYTRFGRDVFLHRLQVSTFAVGHVIEFGVFINKQGQPQAKDLRAAPHAKAACIPDGSKVNPLTKPFSAIAMLEETTAGKPAVPNPQETQSEVPLNTHAKLFMAFSEQPMKSLNPHAMEFTMPEVSDPQGMAWADVKQAVETAQAEREQSHFAWQKVKAKGGPCRWGSRQEHNWSAPGYDYSWDNGWAEKAGDWWPPEQNWPMQTGGEPSPDAQKASKMAKAMPKQKKASVEPRKKQWKAVVS